MSKLDRILEHLEGTGVLLLQDKKLPCLVSMIAGEKLSSSWWSHPKAREIFRTLNLLEENPDVLFTKLVGGKVTLLHRGLWPAILAVANSHETWQMRGLSSEAKDLLKRVRKEKMLYTSGTAARNLQERLLVRAGEVHTESGAHRVMLESWTEWGKRNAIKAMNLSAAKHALEESVGLNGGRSKMLPWN
jgi:hypothetical protein